MTEDDITRGLQMEPIEPSPVFQARVMRRIRDEAAAPPPIPFPVRRALWIALALVCGLAAPLVRPELAAAGQIDGKGLWRFAALALSVGAAVAPYRLLRHR